MSAQEPRKQVRGRRVLTPYAVWSADCPLGRLIDALDSDEEDVMDAWLASPPGGQAP